MAAPSHSPAATIFGVAVPAHDSLVALGTRQGGIPLLVGLLTSADPDVQAMAAFALAEVARGQPGAQAAIAELGALSSLVVLLRLTASRELDEPSHGAGGTAHAAAAERVRIEAAGALWVLSAGHAANQVALSHPL